ncbi:MAG TPA: ABC transporter substrate-binding protein [Stellaceae bacterium]|nr:ABC transporter substrate-binding protein [Stellaceae bacterium]
MMERMRLTRRSLFLAGAAAVIPAYAGTGRAGAAAKPVEMALIVPLSGPWARQGLLVREGAEMAVADINKAGGIKGLGGAPLKLVIADTGDTPEKAKNAAQRLVSQYPDLVAGAGAWLSSFTLAVSEVTERARLPLLTLSYSDAITDRGFHYIFQSSLPGAEQAKELLPSVIALATGATGAKPKSCALIQDNTAAPMSFVKPMLAGGLAQAGIKLLVHETYTPPLSDATPLVGRVRTANPDFLFLIVSSVPDNVLILEKLAEMGLSHSRLPVVGNGSPLVTPELLKATGPEIVDGVITSLANWPIKGDEELVAAFKKRTGEPWMTQDSISGYGHVQIVAWALDKAGAADRDKVNAAIHAMDTTTGPARYFPGKALKFDANGRRVDAPLVLVQWQGGEPVTVGPPHYATKKAIWTKKQA